MKWKLIILFIIILGLFFVVKEKARWSQEQ